MTETPKREHLRLMKHMKRVGEDCWRPSTLQWVIYRPEIEDPIKQIHSVDCEAPVPESYTYRLPILLERLFASPTIYENILLVFEP